MGHSGRSDVLNRRQSTPPSVSRKNQKFDTSVDRNLADDGYYTSIFRKLLGQELSYSLCANIYLRCWLDFTSNVVGTEAPNFVRLGLLAVNASDEFNTFIAPTTRLIRTTYRSHWYASVHVLGEAKSVGMIRTRSEQNYSYKTDFEIRRENQDFGRQNNSMSRLPLDSNTIGTNTTNGITSPIDSISVGTKTPDPTPQI